MDSEDEVEEIPPWKGVPGTIVLINVYNPNKSKTPSVSLVSTCSLMRHHLRMARMHYIGVCLYGTNDSDTSNFGSQNIAQICPLNLPNLDDYKKLESTDVPSIKQSQELLLSDALWHCSKMFSQCKKQLLSRTVIILTRFDIPLAQKDEKPTLNRIKELVESNIEVKLINVADHDYEPNQIYKHIIMEATQNKDAILPKPLWDTKAIENCMYYNSHRHLALAQLNFEIGEGFSIGVGIYSFLKSNYQLKKSNLDRDTNDIVANVNKTLKVSTESSDDTPMDVDGNEIEQKQLPLLKSELLHCLSYGGEQQSFTDKEKKEMSNPFGPPMLKLLGFKPANLIIKEKWYYKPGYFLYPNENSIEGSTTAFKALHKACMDMSVVAICVLCTRVNSKPYIVALSPCVQPLGLNVKIGFDVIRIPFMENVRQISVDQDEENIGVPTAHKTVMKDVINKLKFNYNPDMFEDPKVQSQYRAVEVIVLGGNDIEPFKDSTKQQPEKYNDIQEDLFEEIFGPFGAIAAKRPASRDTGTAAKKAKVEEIDEAELENRLRTKKINSYNVSQLKQILKMKSTGKLPPLTGLKKNELVELVYQNCC